LYVLGLVDEEDVLIGCGLRFEEVIRVGDASGDEAVADAAIFFGREDVVADGEVVRVAVDELEGEHSALSVQHSAGRVLKDFI
jgi:hypothetical protein